MGTFQRRSPPGRGQYHPFTSSSATSAAAAAAAAAAASATSTVKTSEGLSSATKKLFSAAVSEGDGTLPSEAYEKLVKAGVIRSDPRQVSALEPLTSFYKRLSASGDIASKQRAKAEAAGVSGKKKNADPELDLKASPDGISGKGPAWASGGGGDGGGGFFGTMAGLLGMGSDNLERDEMGEVKRGYYGNALKKEGSGGSGFSDEDTDFESYSIWSPQEQGLYMYGGVGCGKTMLMDLAFHTFPHKWKRRVHFHSFMLDVHRRLHLLRQRLDKKHGEGRVDPLPEVASELFDEAWLICFDEFQVTDIADAMVMRRLFSHYFALGGTVVATSNRPPNDLYQNGLQRDLFVPFIRTLERRCTVHDMESTTDYRLTGQASEGETATYFSPLGPNSDARLAEVFQRATGGEKTHAVDLETQGRRVRVPKATLESNVAYFTFNEICGTFVGAADYIAIASSYGTVFIEDIPRLDVRSNADVMRRFITLVDTLYEHHCKLVCSAAAPPSQLVVEHAAVRTGNQSKDKVIDASLNKHGDLLGDSKYVPTATDERFAFDRTVSRLIEMQSVEYLEEASQVAEERRNATSARPSPSSASSIPVEGEDGGGQETTEKETEKERRKQRSAQRNKPKLTRKRSFSVQLVKPEEAKAAFEKYDLNGDGLLDSYEIKRALQDVNEVMHGHRNVTEEELQLAITSMNQMTKDLDRGSESEVDRARLNPILRKKVVTSRQA